MNKDAQYDVIVIGTGSMGSAACYFLANKGLRVLGLDQFEVPHTKGGHTGQSRIIRQAYFEHPDYVPLLKRAYELWNELEHASGVQLFFRTGLVYFGKPGSNVIEGVRNSAALHKIPFENIDISSEFEQFRLPEDFEGIFEPGAGFVIPEATIKTYQSLAGESGTLFTSERVIGFENNGTSVKVNTEKSTYQAEKIIITAGPWVKKLLPSYTNNIKITRQVLAWIKPGNPKDYLIGQFPCWMIADEHPGAFYGFPVLPADLFGEPSGLKLAYHFPGQEADPDNADRSIHQHDLDYIDYVIQNYLPGAKGEIISASTCLYDNSPDENFILDFLPGSDDKIVFATGFSGHGFKFVPVIGEILSDLIISGKTSQPIEFLRSRLF